MKIKTLVSVHVRGKSEKEDQLGPVIVLAPGSWDYPKDIPAKTAKHLLATDQAVVDTGAAVESTAGPSVTSSAKVNVTNPAASGGKGGNKAGAKADKKQDANKDNGSQDPAKGEGENSDPDTEKKEP